MKKLLILFSLILTALRVEAYTWLSFNYAEVNPIDGLTRNLRFSYPDDYTYVRGILVSFNASSGDTRPEYLNSYFKEFLRVNQFGYIGTEGFAQPSTNSNEAALRAFTNCLPVFATASGRAEVNNTPLVLWSASAGVGPANIVIRTNYFKIIAYASGSGTFGAAPVIAAPQIINVPALLWSGDTDVTGIANSMESFVATNRATGLLGSYGVIQGGTHAVSIVTHNIGMGFLQEMINLSYPTNQCILNGPISLTRLTESSGWLINSNSIRTVFETTTNYSSYVGTQSKAYWIPNKNVAYIHRAFATHSSPISLSAPGNETEVNPGLNITITVNDSSYAGWTNMTIFNYSTNLANFTGGSPSFILSNVNSGVYIFSAIATRGGTNVVTKPIMVSVRKTSVPVFACTSASVYYAATNGLPGNAGTLASPWDLWTAGHKTNLLVGGDILYLRGGSYTNTVRNYITNTATGSIFEFLLNGSYNNHITVMPYNGEYVILDSQISPSQYRQHNTDDSPSARPTLKIGDANNANCGRWIKFQDLEIMSSSLEARYANIALDSAFPADIFRQDGVYIYGRSNIIANCRVHDLNSGILSWGAAGGTLLYGNIIYNNGWQSAHRHGHNQYSQNFTNSATKYMMTNFMFNAADKNYQYYGSSDAFVAHYRISGNVSVNSDTLEGGRTGVIIYDHQNTGNFYYNSDLVGIYDYGTNYGDILIANNYLVGGRIQIGAWDTCIVTNNTVVSSAGGDVFDIITQPVGNVLPWTVNRNFYYLSNPTGNYFRQEGFAPINIANWRINTGYEINSTVYSPLPTATNLIVVQKNYFDNNRGHVIIYNYTGGNSVVVNLSTPLSWSTSETVLVRNVQDYYADTTIGVLSGGNLTLDMQASSHTLAVPRGTNGSPWGAKTYPAFGEFVIEKTSPTSTNTLTVTSSPSVIPISVSPNDLNGLNNGTTPFSRLYIGGTVINLNANGVVTDKTFQKWTKGGVDYSTSQNISLPLDTSFTMSAIYTNNATNTITITSSPSGVITTNTPADQLGVTTGASPRTIKYFYNTLVTLDAPSTFQTTNAFLKWTKNGVDFSGVNSTPITTTANDTYSAIYVPASTSAGTNNTFIISRRRPF